MKKTILLFPFLLSGCFMYNNLKQGVECSFDDSKCSEIVVKSESDILNEAAELIKKRCLTQKKLKKGTISFMECNENLTAWFENMLSQYGAEDAYSQFSAALSSEEDKCLYYGMKQGSKVFIQCLEKLEEKDIAQTTKEIQTQRTNEANAWRALGQSLNDFNSTIQQQNDAMVTRSLGGTSCSSHTINGVTYTNCR